MRWMGTVMGVVGTLALVGCGSHSPAGDPSGERVREVDEGHREPAIVPDPEYRPKGVNLRKHQRLYLPIYSNVFVEDERMPSEMTVTVSVRNRSQTPMTLMGLEYFGTKGRKLETVVAKPVQLRALETRNYVIRRNDERGGSGASFMAEWHSDEPIETPLVQAVHVFLGGTQAFSFVTTASPVAIEAAQHAPSE